MRTLSSQLIWPLAAGLLVSSLSACAAFSDAPQYPVSARSGTLLSSSLTTVSSGEAGSSAYASSASEVDVAASAAVSVSGSGIRLPSASLNRYGPVRGLVFPVSLGEQLPMFSDTALAYYLVGSGARDGEEARGASGLLSNESQGVFNLDASVFPNLIDMEVDEAALRGKDRAWELRALAIRVMSRWAAQTDLRPYNNDGGDGSASTRDDDGALDLVLIPVETDSTRFLERILVRKKFNTPGGRVYVNEVGLIGIPRRTDTPQMHANSLARLVLAQMGVYEAGAYAPSGTKYMLNEVGRTALGWSPVQWISKSGDYSLPEGQVLVVPAVDVPNNEQVWLIERVGSNVSVSRATRDRQGVVHPTFSQSVPASMKGGIVPLTRGMGINGPRVRVQWKDEGENLDIALSLSGRAAAEDEARIRGDKRPLWR